jgi:hypothetical protein
MFMTDMTLETRRSSAGSGEGKCAQSMDLTRLCPPSTGDDFDLAAAIAGEGQELFDRQRIRDPFGKSLGARRLIFEMLDRGQAPSPPKARIVWAAMVREKRLTAD